MYKSPEYKAWRHLKDRCLNKRCVEYPRYGARGITVYQEWVESFLKFYEHIGPRPSVHHSVERIDNNLGYVPGNVRWDTQDRQMHNRRPYNKTGIRGVYPNATGWMARIGYKGKDYYLGTYRSIKEAARAYEVAERRLYG